MCPSLFSLAMAVMACCSVLFDGQLVLSLHQPNKGPLERTRLFLVGERPDGLPYVVGRLTEEAVPTACDGS